MFQKFIHKLDSWLWQHGFRVEKIRLITRTLILLNLLLFSLAIILLPFTPFLVYFTLASSLISYSFFDIAQHTLLNFPEGGKQKIQLVMILRFIMRLTITLFISIVCIVVLKANPIALFLGLGLPIITIPVIFLIKK